MIGIPNGYVFVVANFRSCLWQLHLEDSDNPFGRGDGAFNYRPDGGPSKVAQWMYLVRQRCMSYLPYNNMSFDEGTARYTGRMTSYKHRQSRYKPYDGIRIYMLNESKTGLMLLSLSM